MAKKKYIFFLSGKIIDLLIIISFFSFGVPNRSRSCSVFASVNTISLSHHILNTVTFVRATGWPERNVSAVLLLNNLLRSRFLLYMNKYLSQINGAPAQAAVRTSSVTRGLLDSLVPSRKRSRIPDYQSGRQILFTGVR